MGPVIAEHRPVMRGYSIPSALEPNRNAAGYFVPIIERIDRDIAEMKGQIRVLQQDVSDLKEDVTSLKMDFAEMKGEMKALHERADRTLMEYKVIVSDLRTEFKGDIAEMKGDIKALSARLDGQQFKMGLYLTLFGLVIAAIQLFLK